MKKHINKYISLITLMVLSITVSSCFEEDTDYGNDSAKVIPTIFDFTGPTLAFQSSTVTYSVLQRPGSTYTWTVNGAEMELYSDRTDMIDVYFSQAGTATITVMEEAANGLTSETSSLEVEVACNPQPGEYTIEMHDSYGDGWQTDDGDGGSGIVIDIDGSVVEIGMCNPYVASDYDCVAGDYFDAETTITIPDGTISATWTFPGDNYNEISFEVYAPDGSLAFASGDPGDTQAGVLPIVVCVE